MVPRLCPDCAKRNGLDPKLARSEIDHFLSVIGLSFWICPRCDGYVVRKGIRGLIAGLEGNSYNWYLGALRRCHTNGIIG